MNPESIERLAKWGQENGFGFVSKELLAKFAEHIAIESTYQQIKDGAEIMLSLLEDRPIAGEYIHAVHCNADRREPVGNDMCSCRLGKRIAQHRAAASRLQQSLTATQNEVDRLRALLKKAHDAMFSWHSSEYAAHPLSIEVSKGLYQ